MSSKKDWPINGERKNLSFPDQPQKSKTLVRNIISRKQNIGITECVTPHTYTTARPRMQAHKSSNLLVPIHLIPASSYLLSVPKAETPQSQVHYERVVRMLEVVLRLLIASLQHPIWHVPAVGIDSL
jgi:transcriptional regulator with GAF, ATPase, and Fis domain